MCTHCHGIITYNTVNAQLLEGYSSISGSASPSPPKTKFTCATNMLYSICIQPMPLCATCTVENIFHWFGLIHYSVEKNVKLEKKVFAFE